MESISVGIWSILPPILAIVLALVTKEVIPSLVLGILTGTTIYAVYSGLGFIGVYSAFIDLMIEKLSDNASMIIFLALLGALVAVITKAGGSRAYGDWAVTKLKSSRSASVATGLLGVIIFIDDYFNCLTVGTVMKPVTDKHLISREKLAYIIDATAAPVCIIAPISSWAASVISYYPETGSMTGMQAFLSSIPMNLYAILTLFMVFWLAIRKNGDFGPMAKAEREVAQRGTVISEDSASTDDDIAMLEVTGKGKVLDLVIPIVTLVIFAILSMLLYGGYWSGEGLTLFEAFGETDAAASLSLAGFGALIVTFIMFIPRKLLKSHEYFSAVGIGIKSMVPAIIILTLAWTMSGVCRDLLSTGEFVAGVIPTSKAVITIIPAIMFLIAALLSFATGTSWGTFGILIPIIIEVCDKIAPELTITALSAILAGSVFGDHCSPISDTTILSSTGAGCNHIRHVSTQLGYTVPVAIICFIGYLVAGLTRNLNYSTSLIITLAVSLSILVSALLILPKVWRRES